KRLWHNLTATAVVQHLSGDQLKRLFSAMQLVRLEPQSTVAEEGSREAFLLLIVTGTVEGFVLDGGREVVVRSFTSGDIIGEAPLLERGTWPASYRAADQVTALRLAREGLEQALVGNSDPRGFLEILREQHNDRDVAATVRRVRGN
ncbi:MAG: cyclic nucleotide-binding domain-containing protein, partial [Acidobacteriota bacterium]